MVGTSVVYDIIARDRASKAFRDAAGSASLMQKRMEKASVSLRNAGRAMTHAFTLPVLAAGGASVKLASDFQASMMRIHTQAGGSIKDVHELSKAILGLGGKVQQTPEELAASMYHLKSVGLDNVKAMQALRAASHFAAVGGASLEDTTNALAGAWRSGIKGAHNFTSAAATLNAVIGAGNMKMEDLNGALSTGLTAAAKSFGVSLKDVGSGLALMTDEGIPAQQAATRLRMSLSLLGAPSGAADKVLQGIGLSGHALGEELRKPDGLLKTIELLHEHLAGLNNYYPNPAMASRVEARLAPIVKPLLDKKHLTRAQMQLVNEYGNAKENHSVLAKGRLDAAEQAAVISRAFGGGRSGSGIMTLLNNLDVLQQKEAQVNKSASKSRFGDSMAKQAQTAAAKFATLKGAVETAGVKIGNTLLPYVTKLVVWIGKLATGFSGLSTGWQRAIITAGLFLAVLGPLLTIAGNLIRVVMGVQKAMLLLDAAMVANPIGVVTVAIAALVAAFILAYKHSQTFRNIVSGVFYDVGLAGKALWNNVLRPVFKFIVDTWLNVAGAIVNGAAHAFGWVPGIGGKLKQAASWFNDFRDKVNRSLSGIHDRNVKITADATQAISATRDLKSYLDSISGKHVASVEVHRRITGGLNDLLLTPAGKRAGGGLVGANRPYIVGENGPELFTSSQSGRIIPNAGRTVNINIEHLEAHDYHDFMRQLDQRQRTAAMGVLAS